MRLFWTRWLEFLRPKISCCFVFRSVRHTLLSLITGMTSVFVVSHLFCLTVTFVHVILCFYRHFLSVKIISLTPTECPVPEWIPVLTYVLSSGWPSSSQVSTVANCAFSVVAARTWNDLPSDAGCHVCWGLKKLLLFPETRPTLVFTRRP